MKGNMPEKVVQFNAYDGGKCFVGLVDVELPNVQMQSETISGAGISGELDAPTLGHTGAMTCKLKFRTKTKHASKLFAPRSQQIELRASVQSRSVGEGGSLVTSPEKIVLRGMPKGFNLGKLENGKPEDSDLELAVDYIKVFLDGEAVLEIDKLACVFMVDGVDYLASVRSDIGMEG